MLVIFNFTLVSCYLPFIHFYVLNTKCYTLQLQYKRFLTVTYTSVENRDIYKAIKACILVFLHILFLGLCFVFCIIFWTCIYFVFVTMFFLYFVFCVYILFHLILCLEATCSLVNIFCKYISHLIHLFFSHMYFEKSHFLNIKLKQYMDDDKIMFDLNKRFRNHTN